MLRSRSGGLGLALLGGAALGTLALWIAVRSRPPAPPPVAPVAQDEQPSGAGAAWRRELAALRAELDVQARDRAPAEADAIVRRLQDAVARLALAEVDADEAAGLAKVAAALRELEGRWRAEAAEEAAWSQLGPEAEPGAEVTAQEDPGEEEAAEARLTVVFQDVLQAALRRRAGTPVLRALEEALGGAALRAELADRLWDAVLEARPGAQEALALEPRWLGLLGAAGYEALLRRCPAERAALRASLEARRDQAARFEAAVSALEAAARGEHAGAPLDLAGDTPWHEALRALAARVSSGATAGASASGREPSAAGPAAASRTRDGWRPRFAALAEQRRGAREEERAALAPALLEQLEAAHAEAQGGLERCEDVLAFLDGHARLLRAPALAEAFTRIERLYFDLALARCSGPATFARLAAWCEARDHDAWREELAPFLRLVRVAVGPEAAGRERARRRRAAAIEAVREFSAKRLAGLAEELWALLEWMAEERCAPEAARAELDALIARAIERAGGPEVGRRLREALRAVPHAPQERGEERARELARRLERVVRRTVNRSLKATERAIEAGEPGLAFDLFQYVLLLDPDDERAHKGLGHVRVEGEWVRAYVARRRREGWLWDARAGWVPRKGGRERLAAGDVFDPDVKGFAPRAAADARHADPARPWVIATEHFELRSTAPLHRGAWIAERLEAFYLAMFRQYDLFFAAKGGAKLIFGVSSLTKPLVVHFYRDRAQYLASAPGVIPGSAGFYSPAQHASFFYDQGEDVSTLQHEVTHQILGETSSGGEAPAWVTEGAAVFLEGAFFRDGVLTLGALEDNRDVRAYRDGLRAGTEWSLKEVVALTSQAAWNAGLSHKNYRGAGATVYFLCHFDGGRYRADFVELLRDAYQGRPVSVEATFNLPVSALDALMRRFYGG